MTTWTDCLANSRAVWGDWHARRAVLHYGDPGTEYAAITSSTAVVDFSDRTLVELVGADRAAFLHNMCTNEIRKLPAGSGCEAFLTDASAKILAYVWVAAGPQTLVLETVHGQAPRLLKHLGRYIIREDVQLIDRGEEWGELLLAGAGAAELLQEQLGSTPPSRPLDHTHASLRGLDVHVWRVELTKPNSFLVRAMRAELPRLWSTLTAAGARACGQEALEAARIEAGSPYYEQDITDQNLPQEVARDDRAISFVKGCYIGQETVARIDSRGHVNKTLVGMRIEGRNVPPAGLELTHDGRAVGHVTSAAFSPKLDSPLALGYVRRGLNEARTTLDSPLGRATVVTLPV